MRTKEEIIKDIQGLYPSCYVVSKVCFNQLKKNYHFETPDFRFDIDVFQSGKVEIDLYSAPILSLKEMKLYTELMEVLENEKED